MFLPFSLHRLLFIVCFYVITVSSFNLLGPIYQGIRLSHGWFDIDGEFKSGENISHQLEHVPPAFDAREKWPQCPSVGTIDKGDCNFWAVSVASVLTDRLCIATNGKDTFEYSSEDLLTCCEDCQQPEQPTDKGCPAANIVTAMDYVKKNGLVSGGSVNSSRGCKPLTGKKKSVCKSECTNKDYKTSYNQDKRYATGFRKYHNKYAGGWSGNEQFANVQGEIMTKGPVLTLLQCPVALISAQENGSIFGNSNDTMDTIYSKMILYDMFVVKLIGWGIEDGVLYWTAAHGLTINNTVVKILRGKNLLDMEQLIFAPEPLLLPPNPLLSPSAGYYIVLNYFFIITVVCHFV